MKNAKYGLDKLLSSMSSNIEVDDTPFIVNVQKELLNGKPLPKERYYKLLNVTKEKADSILELLGELDENDDITAFSGLSITPTKHKFIVKNKTLYTWCALDTILFTKRLDVSSHVISYDPIDKTVIELKIEGGRLRWSNSHSIYVSWVENIDTCNIKGSFCDHVFFFSGKKSANQWLDSNPDGNVISIDEFFEPTKIGLKCC